MLYEVITHEVSIEDIQANQPDVVVLATGSLPLLPSIEGIDNDIVLTYEDVLNGDSPSYKNVVVIGGGPTVITSYSIHYTKLYECFLIPFDCNSELLFMTQLFLFLNNHIIRSIY